MDSYCLDVWRLTNASQTLVSQQCSTTSTNVISYTVAGSFEWFAESYALSNSIQYPFSTLSWTTKNLAPLGLLGVFFGFLIVLTFGILGAAIFKKVSAMALFVVLAIIICTILGLFGLLLGGIMLFVIVAVVVIIKVRD